MKVVTYEYFCLFLYGVFENLSAGIFIAGMFGLVWDGNVLHLVCAFFTSIILLILAFGMYYFARAEQGYK